MGGVGVGATWWGGGSVDGTLYVEGGELGVVGMMAGPSSVKGGRRAGISLSRALW